MGLPWPEWGETDYLLTQALDMWEHLHCSRCGCWMPESHDDQAADSYKVEQAAHCHGCEALERWQRVRDEDADPPRGPGAKFRVLIPDVVKARWRRVATAVADSLADGGV